MRREAPNALDIEMNPIKRHTNNFFIGGENFRKEFKRQIRLLTIITFGFTIAFTWRQTIFDTTQSLVTLITNVKSSATLSILTSVTITIVSLFFIYITSYFLKDNADY